MSELASESELRRLAERRVDAKAGFWIHAANFVVDNAGWRSPTEQRAAVRSSWSAGCWGWPDL